MTNAENYKPVVTELVDLMNQQKKLALNLFIAAKTSANDKIFLDEIRDYLSAIDDQAEALEKIVRRTEISAENDAFKKITSHK